MNRTEMKDLYKEKAVLEEELDNLTYLGNDVSYADYVESTEQIENRISEIYKELRANGEEF